MWLKKYNKNRKRKSEQLTIKIETDNVWDLFLYFIIIIYIIIYIYYIHLAWLGPSA